MELQVTKILLWLWLCTICCKEKSNDSEEIEKLIFYGQDIFSHFPEAVENFDESTVKDIKRFYKQLNDINTEILTKYAEEMKDMKKEVDAEKDEEKKKELELNYSRMCTETLLSVYLSNFQGFRPILDHSLSTSFLIKNEVFLKKVTDAFQITSSEEKVDKDRLKEMEEFLLDSFQVKSLDLIPTAVADFFDIFTEFYANLAEYLEDDFEDLKKSDISKLQKSLKKELTDANSDKTRLDAFIRGKMTQKKDKKEFDFSDFHLELRSRDLDPEKESQDHNLLDVKIENKDLIEQIVEILLKYDKLSESDTKLLETGITISGNPVIANMLIYKSFKLANGE